MVTSKSPAMLPRGTVPESSYPSGTLSLDLRISLVVGSIIGSGIFSLPKNMAAGAGAGVVPDRATRCDKVTTH